MITSSTARNALHSTLALCVVATAGAALLRAGSDHRSVAVKVNDERIDVTIGGRPFTTLHTAKEPRKLYLHPLLTASGNG